MELRTKNRGQRKTTEGQAVDRKITRIGADGTGGKRNHGKIQRTCGRISTKTRRQTERRKLRQWG